METKFTKGEWRQSHRKRPDGMYSTEVYDENGKTICTLAWHKVPIKGGYATDREANAKLIAAAPEMYKALIETDKDLCVLESIMRQIELTGLEIEEIKYSLGGRNVNPNKSKSKILNYFDTIH